MMNDDNNELLLSLYKHLLVMKTFHFQTRSGFRHSKVDEYLSKYLSNMDKMMEISQGLTSVVSLEEIDLSVPTRTDTDIVRELENMIDVLEQERGRASSLDALIDEMQGDLQQLNYLLTFK